MALQGPASAVERAFSVHLFRYVARDGLGHRATFYAPGSNPELPSVLARVARSVLGLDDYPDGAPAGLAVGRTNGNSGPQNAGGYTPAQVEGMYHFGPLYQGGVDGAGQTVVFLEIDGYQPSDIEQFSSTLGLPSADITGPVTNQAWGSAQAASSSNEPTEATLDLEVVHSLAPQAHLVVYESDNSGADMLAALQAAVNAYPHAVFSYSLGITACSQTESGEDLSTANQFSAVFEQLDRTGGTALLSSGDSGAFSCPGTGAKPGPQMPADSPWVTAVGGTTAFIGAGGTYGEEAAWGDPVEQSGDGGGLSTVFKRPSWQAGPGVPNQYSNGMRQLPDVAAVADLTTGWDIYSAQADPQWQVVGGTSAAAPLWAALMALADQALAQRHLPAAGLADPALYDFGTNPGKFPAKAFHDVTLGSDLYYPATPGWDFATGWGSPDASAVVDDFIAYQAAR